MRRLKTLGLIFAFAFGMKFAFVGGVHAEGNFPANSQAEEPLEERERGVIIDESGGWMKIMENHPFIEENEEELDFILLSEEFLDNPTEGEPSLNLRKKLK